VKIAAKAFRRAISLDPSMEVFHEHFAEALRKSGDLSGAETEYRAALSLYDAQYKTGEPTDSFHSFMRSMVKVENNMEQNSSLAKHNLYHAAHEGVKRIGGFSSLVLSVIQRKSCSVLRFSTAPKSPDFLRASAKCSWKTSIDGSRLIARRNAFAASSLLPRSDSRSP